MYLTPSENLEHCSTVVCNEGEMLRNEIQNHNCGLFGRRLLLLVKTRHCNGFLLSVPLKAVLEETDGGKILD